MYKRNPVVSGAFYPGSSRELQAVVENYLVPAMSPEPAIGMVAPHAGFAYSGHTAGAVYSQVRIPPVAVIIAPNHSGKGRAFGGAAVISEGVFLTPLGEVLLESSLAEDFKSRSTLFVEDREAHEDEHSLEVQLPFIQVIRPDVRIVPLVVSYDDFHTASTIGTAIGEAIRDFDEDVLVIASSDMTHYQPRNVASKLDRFALDRIESLDPEGLLKVTREEGITMCGRAPVATMLVTAMVLGASTANLVDYSDSGDVSGDTSYVVGYAGIVIR